MVKEELIRYIEGELDLVEMKLGELDNTVENIAYYQGEKDMLRQILKELKWEE